jgi:hypothetical protein
VAAVTRRSSTRPERVASHSSSASHESYGLGFGVMMDSVYGIGDKEPLVELEIVWCDADEEI